MKKNIQIIAVLSIMAFTVTACQEKFEPGGPEKNIFENPYSTTPFEQQLQKDFFQKNHIYILFNDTLTKEQTGKNTFGEPFYTCQLVNVGNSLNSSINTNIEALTFTLLDNDEDKKAGADFINQYILPSLGHSLQPFSFLIVDKVNYYINSYGSKLLTNPAIYSGWRCSAVAVKGISTQTEEQKKAQRNTILKTIVTNAITKLDQTIFDEFYSFCTPYYSTYAMNAEAEAFINTHPTMYDVGFLSAYSYGKPYGFYIYNFKAKNYDLEDYTQAVFNYTATQFEALYGNYPIVMRKYEILSNIIKDLGVIL